MKHRLRLTRSVVIALALLAGGGAALAGGRIGQAWFGHPGASARQTCPTSLIRLMVRGDDAFANDCLSEPH